MKRIIKAPMILLVLSLSACQSYWEPDSHLGSSVNDVIKMQVANPQAPANSPESIKGMDGISAKASIDNYQNSFIRRGVATGTSSSFVTGTQPNSGSSSTNVGIPQQ